MKTAPGEGAAPAHRKLARALLDLWHGAHDLTGLPQEDFAAWSGATKDLLLKLGLEWSVDLDDYFIRGPRSVLARVTAPRRLRELILCPRHLRQIVELDGATLEHEVLTDDQLELWDMRCLMCGVAAVPDRRCANSDCGRPLHPEWPAVYCSNACAEDDR
jgi:hypothetical protein